MEHYPRDHRFYVQQEYEMRLVRRPHYSLRAYARDLGVSPSTLTDFLKGTFGFSRARVIDLAKKLNLSEGQRQHFCDLVESKFARHDEKKRSAKLRVAARIGSKHSDLSLQMFQIIADWRHMAILELIELDEKYQDVKVIAKSLDTTVKNVRECIDRLISVGLLVSKNDLIKTSSSSTFVGQDIPSKAIRQYHHQILSKAQAAIEEQSVDRRELSSTVVSIRREDLPDFKDELRKALMELMTKYTSRKTKDSVYCLSLQLFDLLTLEETTHAVPNRLP